MEVGRSSTGRDGSPAGLKRAFALVAAVVALLCLGGSLVAYRLYDDATGPDRSAPDVVVDNYLRAYLVDRDDARADQYVCRDAADLGPLRALRDDIQAREQQYGVRIAVTWGSLQVETVDERRAVTTDVRRTIADGSERAQDRWQFEVVDQDGWRVCGARRLS